MCGIAGVLGRSPDLRTVAAMVDIQRHRGPDDRGVQDYGDAVLGHSRLAILDLTSHAHQPMESEDGRYVLIFNGEIYNFKELRAELDIGHSFHSSGDTEVLLAAWEKWGEGCLERLNGMFAFCVWDRRDHVAFFARDRFGQKPLYYMEYQGCLLFSSEIKGILAAGVPVEANRATWVRYLYKASYDDSAETFFSGISQLMPGGCATWSEKEGFKQRQWYRLASQLDDRSWDAENAIATVREVMVNAAQLHMRSDVPVGISLSGGLDSSALLACFSAADRLHPRTSGLSIEFGGEQGYSEREWVKAAADHHDVDLSIETYTPEDSLTDFVPLLWHSEAPLGGLMNLGRAKVMAMAKRHGIKVMQDGTGLDEAFAGYQVHHDLYVGECVFKSLPNADQAVKDYAAHWGVDEETARRRGQAAWSSVNTQAIDGTIMTKSEMLSQEALKEAANLSPTKAENQLGDPLRDSLLDYILIRKIPRNTRFTDRMSMAYGVELRFPFLDHRLIECGLSLPKYLHFLGGRSKSIVREAMAGLMADSVRLAPKRSVHTPQGAWLQSEPLKSFVGDIIHSRSFAERGYFDVPKCQALFDRFCSGAFDNSFFIWQWINTETWYRLFVDNNAAAQTHLLDRSS